MAIQPARSQPDSAPIVTWEVTRACRLNCLHCSVAAQQRRSPLELSTYEAYKTIDQIVALRPEEFIMTGGDILERADIYQLIDYARRRGVKPTINVTVTPSLTGAVIGKLKHNGADRLSVALDSSAPERHDLARGINGHFSSTLLALRWARTAELHLEANTLVTRRNLSDISTIAELLGDISVDRWNVYFVVPIGPSKNIEPVTGEESERALVTLAELAALTPFAIRVFEAPQYRRVMLQKKAKDAQESIDKYFGSEAEMRITTAAAGPMSHAVDGSAIFVSHTGEVSTSQFVPLTAGNVRYQPLSTVYRTSELFGALRETANLKGKCGACEFSRICGGSRARAFAMTGDLFAADPLCIYQPGEFAPAPAAPRHAEV